MTRQTLGFIGNLLSFQICWVAFVWGGANQRWWLGFIPLAVFSAWQLRATRWPRTDLVLIGVGMLIGALIETTMIRGGFFTYASQLPFVTLAPFWMLGMWAGFALTLNHSMAFFKSRLLLAATFGLFGGPLAYWIAGRAWNALAIPEPQWPSLLAIGVAWCLAMPLLCGLAQRLSLREQTGAL